MFGTYERHNLRRVAFSREASYWALYEDFREPIIGLTVIKDAVMLDKRANTWLCYPTWNGQIVPYTYFADASELKLITEHGEVCFAMDGYDQLRIRGSGVGLRLVLRAEDPFGSTCGCKGIYPTPFDAWEADMDESGKVLFVPLAGGMFVDAPAAEGGEGYERVEVSFIPDAASGVCEAALHEHMSFRSKNESYVSYAELHQEAAESFKNFKETNFRAAPAGWEELHNYCAYVLWSHRVGVCGKFEDTMVAMHQVWAGYCMSWQQSYNALPMLKNPREGWRLIKTMFAHQAKNGQLPSSVQYYGVAHGSMQPAFQALALDWLFWSCGDDFLTREDCEEMYPKFKKWLNFWLEYRNAGYGDDRVTINGAHESGWDDLSLYKDGFPIETPDLYSYMIMMMDCLAVMARKLELEDEAADWKRRSAGLLDTLCTELWNGERFVGLLTKSGKKVESLSLAIYQALVLGKERLPEYIIDTLTKSLMTEDFLTDIGLTTESMKSPLCHFGYNFVLGRVITPCNALTAIGLWRCGKKEEAKEVSRRVCKNLLEQGIILGFAPFDYEVTTGEPVVTWPNPTGSDGWAWTSWAASSAMAMITGILGGE